MSWKENSVSEPGTGSIGTAPDIPSWIAAIGQRAVVGTASSSAAAAAVVAAVMAKKFSKFAWASGAAHRDA